MDVINWVASLSAAQRDAIRTIALAIGSGFVPLIGVVMFPVLRRLFKLTRQVLDNTQTSDFVDGKLTATSVAETARHVKNEFRSEITDLVNDPRTGPPVRTGRRRLPTTEIPSLYESRPPHE